MTSFRIVATTATGGVAVTTPAPECVEALRDGGWISRHVSRWRRVLNAWLKSRGVTDAELWVMYRHGMPIEVALEWEAFKFWADPRWQSDLDDRRRWALAMRWVTALHTGGLEERQAVALIGEVGRCAGETALEIVDVSEIPKDRTRRDEWRRSTNGGPIIVPEYEDMAA